VKGIASLLVLRSAEGASRRTTLRIICQNPHELKACGAQIIVCATSIGERLLDGASIYILRCADGSYYTGVTRRSVDERVSEHALGLDEGCYTFRRRPVTLVHAEHYSRIVDAVATERRIKGWSRAKKEAYIRGDYAALVALAKRSGKRALRDG
jgi:putative endonuclease